MLLNIHKTNFYVRTDCAAKIKTFYFLPLSPSPTSSFPPLNEIHSCVYNQPKRMPPWPERRKRIKGGKRHFLCLCSKEKNVDRMFSSRIFFLSVLRVCLSPPPSSTFPFSAHCSVCSKQKAQREMCLYILFFRKGPAAFTLQHIGSLP